MNLLCMHKKYAVYQLLATHRPRYALFFIQPKFGSVIGIVILGRPGLIYELGNARVSLSASGLALVCAISIRTKIQPGGLSPLRTNGGPLPRHVVWPPQLEEHSSQLLGDA